MLNELYMNGMKNLNIIFYKFAVLLSLYFFQHLGLLLERKSDAEYIALF